MDSPDQTNLPGNRQRRDDPFNGPPAPMCVDSGWWRSGCRSRRPGGRPACSARRHPAHRLAARSPDALPCRQTSIASCASSLRQKPRPDLWRLAIAGPNCQGRMLSAFHFSTDSVPRTSVPSPRTIYNTRPAHLFPVMLVISMAVSQEVQCYMSSRGGSMWPIRYPDTLRDRPCPPPSQRNTAYARRLALLPIQPTQHRRHR